MKGTRNKLLLSLIWFIPILSPVAAQTDNLLQHESYYHEQLSEFKAWLKQYHFDRLVSVEGLQVHSNQVVLHLVSAFKNTTLDSLPLAWDAMQFEYEKQYSELLENRLFEGFVFHNDLQPHQAKIHIRSHQLQLFDLTIWADHWGDMHVEETKRISYLSSGVFNINQNELRQMTHGGTDTLIYQSVTDVRRAISKYLYQYYSDKGTPVLYKATIDTTRTYYNELTYKITNISHEVLDDGFFEYIRINISVADKGDLVEIKWNFQGKYGSGILFAPRESQYKNMEVRYASQLQRYEQDLIKQITHHLKRRP